MSTYAIGDVQGCYAEFIQLLDEINFNEQNDILWFVGDLVNRGPDSLKTLQFIKSLGNNAKVVLGNHDFHLLAIANNIRKPHKKDTLDEVINADDASELLTWLRQRPLHFHDSELKFTMVHAGLPPQWSLQEAKELASETESLIRSQQFDEFLNHMYGNQPDSWSSSLTGNERYRFIINCFTRIRYVDQNGRIDMDEKGAPGSQADSLLPWYKIKNRKTMTDKIIFGHWSTIHLGNEKNFSQYNVYPLDTGCLWGGELTAMRLEDEKLLSVPSKQKKLHK